MCCSAELQHSFTDDVVTLVITDTLERQAQAPIPPREHRAQSTGVPTNLSSNHSSPFNLLLQLNKAASLATKEGLSHHS